MYVAGSPSHFKCFPSGRMREVLSFLGTFCLLHQNSQGFLETLPLFFCGLKIASILLYQRIPYKAEKKNVFQKDFAHYCHHEIKSNVSPP